MVGDRSPKAPRQADATTERRRSVVADKTMKFSASSQDQNPDFSISAASTDAFPFLHPPADDDEIGRLGNYRVLQLLGKGGMGLVFRAEDIALQRPVALKVMRPDLVRESNSSQRFLREARIMAAIKHDHLVTVYQAAQENGAIYLAMELLAGETLEDRVLRDGPLPAADILRFGRGIAAGLAVIHSRNLIHRDLKPSNLWLESPGGRIKLLDFGLARSVEDDQHCTQTGVIVGTPGFMSPEQARGDPLDARTDLFSFGSVLYFLCTGHAPFAASNTMGVLTALAVNSPTPPHELNPRIPRRLAKLVMRLLSKDRDSRPASANAAIKLIDRISEEEDHSEPTAVVPPSRRAVSRTAPMTVTRRRRPAPRPKRRWPWVVAGALGVVAIVGLTLPMLMGRTSPPVLPGSFAAGATFLSDLTPSDATAWIRTPPKPPNGEKGQGQAPWRGIMVQGQPSPHGLFMHPPTRPDGGVGRVRYRLDAKFGEFHAEVSLNDGPGGSETPLTFVVFGDGRELWRSAPVKSQDDRQRCDLTIRGVNELTLEVRCPGFPHGAHAVWIEPHMRE